jgi:D-aspartate ligase
VSALNAKSDPIHEARLNGSRPPVIILNLSYTGLGIARDMSGRGVRVVGFTSDDDTYGNFTRTCEVWFTPDARQQPERLAAVLLAVAHELGGAVIFPTSDFDVLFLDRYRSALEPHYRLSIPPSDCLTKVMDKQALFRWAQDVGVAVPKTRTVDSWEQLADAAKEIGFPCVLKPVSSIHWRKHEDLHGGGAHAKAMCAHNEDELKSHYLDASSLDHRVLIQEWIPGSADRLAVLGGYVDDSSELLAYFTARKIIQSPEEFGTGCLVESVDIPALVDPTARLLRSLVYRGMAEVEYKFDSVTGQYKLIEINPRHWDWHRLGNASGVNLTWTAYCHLTGQRVERRRLRTAPAKWIAEDTLAHYCFQHAIKGRINARKLINDLSGPRIYGIFAWSDPLPFVRYSLTVGLPRLGKKIVTELGHKAGFFSLVAASILMEAGVPKFYA